MTVPAPIADVMIQLSEHIDEFADAMPRLASEGRFWWFRPSDNTFHATDEKPGAPGDFYLLDTSPPWQDQWGGDWDAAAAECLDTLNAAMGRVVE